MFQRLLGSQPRVRSAPAAGPKLGCEQLGDRVVPAVLVNDVVVNPPTSTDAPHEAIELRVEAGTDLSNYWLAILEGEAPGMGGQSQGVIDGLIDVGQYKSLFESTFADHATVDHVIVFMGTSGTGYTGTSGALVIPRTEFNSTFLENGSASYVTLKSTSPTINSESGDIGNDLDAGNDGTLDAITNITYVDGVGFRENSNDKVYGFDVTPSNGKDPDYITRDASNAQAYFEDGAYSGTNQTWSAAELANTRNANGDYKIDEVTFGNVVTTSDYTTIGGPNL